MKRKILFGITSILSIAIILCACSKAKEKNIYDTLNELKAFEYHAVSLSVSTVVDGEALSGNYKTTKTEDGYDVEYTYEQLQTFKEQNGNIIIPESRKAIYRGTASVINGKITAQIGDPIDVSLKELSAKYLDFSEDYFDNVNASEDKFSAKVVDTEGFFGKTVTGNMMVEISYTEHGLSSITLSYGDGLNGEYVLTYSFQVL